MSRETQPEDMQLRRVEDGLWAKLNVDVDLYNAGAIKGQLLEEVANDPDINHVLFDLERVEFVDATFLGVAVGFVKRLRQRGGGVSMATDNPNLTKIIEITGLDHVIQMMPYPNVVSDAEGNLHWVKVGSKEYKARRTAAIMRNFGILAEQIGGGLETRHF